MNNWTAYFNQSSISHQRHNIKLTLDWWLILFCAFKSSNPESFNSTSLNSNFDNGRHGKHNSSRSKHIVSWLAGLEKMSARYLQSRCFFWLWIFEIQCALYYYQPEPPKVWRLRVLVNSVLWTHRANVTLPRSTARHTWHMCEEIKLGDNCNFCG